MLLLGKTQEKHPGDLPPTEPDLSLHPPIFHKLSVNAQHTLKFQSKLAVNSYEIVNTSIIFACHRNTI